MYRIIEMNILFWNLKDNNNANHIVSLIRQNNIDIAVFCEFKSLNREIIERELTDFSFSTDMTGCEKVIFLFKSSITNEVRRESNRYAMYSFEYNSTNYTIVGVHLPDQRSCDSAARKAVIGVLMRELDELEKENKNYNTIIIGDFNAGPLDSELTQKDMFNAVPFKDVIKKRDVIEFQHKKYRRFYNPMVHYISEDTKQYGSFRYTGGSSTVVWYTFDQVIVRKPLIDNINNIFYCKSIGNMELLSVDGIPKASISDHLPLIVELR